MDQGLYATHCSVLFFSLSLNKKIGMNPREGIIKQFSLKNFTCFADLEVSFSNGINLIIGENGLGKTHMLKAIYGLTLIKQEEVSGYNVISFVEEPDSIYGKKGNNPTFIDLFNINNESQLISKNKLNFLVRISRVSGNDYASSNIFIPVLEMLSWYKGFVPSYENRENSIDYVYYLLAKKLAPLPFKGEKLEEQKLLIQDLENQLGFKVARQGDEFFIFFAQDQVHNSKLVANGINKLAQLIYLIMNGSLTKNSIIFWDEPEAGFNPKYIVLVAKFLQTLAKAGCQIFVATHDYLLSHTLSLAAEYRDVQPDTPSMRFHALYKTPEGTQIESADTLTEIQHNSILDEYSRFYKIEEELFYQSMKVKE